jgi:hypothetical protein
LDALHKHTIPAREGKKEDEEKKKRKKEEGETGKRGKESLHPGLCRLAGLCVY